MNDHNKPDEWFKVAERLGNQLASNIEKFGDKVQKVVESLDDKIRAEPSVTVEDARSPEAGEGFASLRVGQAFEYSKTIYVRLGALPEASEAHSFAVDITSGAVRSFSEEDEVKPVRVKVSLHESTKAEREL